MPNILDNPLYRPPHDPPRHFPYPQLNLKEATELGLMMARAIRVGLTPTDRERCRELRTRSYRPEALG